MKSKNNLFTPLLALTALAITIGGMSTAYGQYQITGTTAGGGNGIVVGNGLLFTITSLGRHPLSHQQRQRPLHVEYRELSPPEGSHYGAAIAFGTPNNVFVNNATIFGATDNEDPAAGTGVIFFSNNFLEDSSLGTTNLTNETVINHGNIFASQQEEDEIVGNEGGLPLPPPKSRTSMSSTPASSWEANQSFDAEISGVALSFLSEEADIAQVSIFNSGNLIGGNENDDAEVMSSGISFLAANGIFDVSITNAAGGNITGGSGNDSFGDPILAEGNGIVMLDENDEGGLGPEINGVVVSNAGNIMGGEGNSGGSEEFDSNYFISNGIAIGGLGDIKNITVNNSSTGLIEGGSENDGGWFVGTGIGIGAVGNNVETKMPCLMWTSSTTGRIEGGNQNEEASTRGWNSEPQSRSTRWQQRHQRHHQ